MSIFEAIQARRSIKQFTDRTISREEIERLLDAAVQAPNHRMTEPWRFYVLGPEARREYGAALGARKAKKVEDAEAAEAVVQKAGDTHAALPAMLAVSVTLDDNPEIREEDYAAAFMGIQNLCLAAFAMGLGAHIKTGAVMDDPRARAAVRVPDEERIIATIHFERQRPAGNVCCPVAYRAGHRLAGEGDGPRCRPGARLRADDTSASLYQPIQSDP